MNSIEKIEKRLSPFKDELVNHRIYDEIDRLEALQLFVEQHVFAVWDFMSLIKVLQRRICCVEVPWLLPVDAQASRFINEIVLAEESDDNSQVGFASHFDIYHRSMKQSGSSIAGIDSNLRTSPGVSIRTALASPTIPKASGLFVEYTFTVIDSDNLCAIGSAFTFGRENLLPDVFQRFVDKLDVEAGKQLADFKFYLERHIGLNGDEHLRRRP